MRATTNEPDMIVLHCTASPNHRDKIGLKEINEWHAKRGFYDHNSKISCGYHYIIRRDGVVEAGRPETSQGAHAKHHNKDSLGICYVGNDLMTKEQVDALLGLYKALALRHAIPPSRVFGHNEFPEHKGRGCPNQDMNVIRKLLEVTLEQSNA